MSKVYQIITNKIVKRIQETKTLPWRIDWKILNPMNLISKMPYRGFNRFILGVATFKSPYWLTFNQCNKLGGKVNLGQHPEMTVKVSENSLRYFLVWNTEQCLLPPGTVPEFSPEPEYTFKPDRFIPKCKLDEYSVEELINEFIAHYYRMNIEENVSEERIQGWIKFLQDNIQAIISAGSQSEKSIEWITEKEKA